MSETKEEYVFFRFYDLDEKLIEQFVEEIKSLPGEVFKEIIRTEVVDSNKTMNIIARSVVIKEARVWFKDLEACKRFHERDAIIVPVYRKFTNMSNTTKGEDITVNRRDGNDKVFYRD